MANKTMMLMAAALLVAGCGGGTTTTVATPEGTMSVNQVGNEVTVRNEETGQVVTSGTGMPADFPAEFVYPAALEVLHTFSDNQGAMSASIKTGDAPEKVISFYQHAAASGGWQVEATLDLGTSRFLTGQRGSTGFAIEVRKDPQGGPSLVVVQMAPKE
jgi:hypothetical protein